MNTLSAQILLCNTFSHKRNHSSLEKWLILTLGQEIHRISLKNLVVKESKEVPSLPKIKSHVVGACQRGTEVN